MMQLLSGFFISAAVFICLGIIFAVVFTAILFIKAAKEVFQDRKK